MMGYYGYGFDYGLFHFLGFVFWVVVVILILKAIRRSRMSGWRPPYWMDGTQSRGIEILKERYAKGEISKEEFEAKKKDLTS
jgi:putative membrane protein